MPGAAVVGRCSGWGEADGIEIGRGRSGLQDFAGGGEGGAFAGRAAGTSKRPPMECGTDMYGRSFEDLDGHIWELMYMSPAAVEKGAHGS